jgi:WD40 repeat protein
MSDLAKKQVSIKSFFQRSLRVDGPSEMSPKHVSVVVNMVHEETVKEHQEKVMPNDIEIPNENDDTSMSYEKIREQNIRRNSDFLAQLGLDEVLIPRSVGEKRKGPKKRSLQGNEESHRPLPKRIQPKRGAKTAVVAELPVDNTREEEGVSDKEIEIAETLFEDSSVLTYAISIRSEIELKKLVPSQTFPWNSADSVPTLLPLPSLQSDTLSAVYSLHPHPAIPSLIVAAGKGGQVAVYSIRDDSPSSHSPSPLLDFRAHSRWISSAKFFSKSKSVDEEAHIRLLTAADDGLLKLWDIAQCNLRSDPKILCTVSLHEKGIFSMDERGGQILTGSKDRSVAVSLIQTSGEIQKVHNFLDLHASVVKSVQWKPGPDGSDCPPQVFASGGQDSSIFVQDTRSDSPALHIPAAHEGGVHTVSWCPVTSGSDGSEHLLMSAGYDSSVKIFDVRACGGSSCSSLHTFRDHNAHLSRRSSITTPSFLTSQHLLIPNEHSSSISIHCTLTGRTLSRGTLEEQPLSVACTRFMTAEGFPRFAVAACKRKGVLIPFRVTNSSA